MKNRLFKFNSIKFTVISDDRGPLACETEQIKIAEMFHQKPRI